MQTVFKSPQQAIELGENLRLLRKRHGKTLQEVQDATEVNVGQLSRFERGDFKRLSANLQSVIEYLSALDKRAQGHPQPELLDRFAQVLARSGRHEAAARALLSALEALR